MSNKIIDETEKVPTTIKTSLSANTEEEPSEFSNPVRVRNMKPPAIRVALERKISRSPIITVDHILQSYKKSAVYTRSRLSKHDLKIVFQDDHFSMDNY